MENLKRLVSEKFVLLSVVTWIFGFSLHIYAFFKSHVFSNLNWKITQYNISYLDYGFVKRGLIGTILNPIFDTLHSAHHQKIAIITIDILLYFIFVGISHRALKSLENSDEEFIIRILLLLSPLGLMQWSFDIGRYDHMCMIIIFFSCIALRNGRLILSGVLLSTSIICHEASAFYGPVILLVLFMHLHSPNEKKILLSVLQRIFLPAALSFLLVVLFGNITSADQLISLEAEHGRGRYVWQRGAFQPALHLSVDQYVINAIYFAAVAFLFFTSFKSFAGRWTVFFLIFPFAMLYLAGIDYPRWAHIFFMSFILIKITAAPSVKKLPNSSNPITPSDYPALFLLLPLGPIGITTVWPYLFSLKRYLEL